MFKKSSPRGRSERIPEAYSQEYIEGLSDARTKLGKGRVLARLGSGGWNSGFFNILLGQVFGWRLCRLHHRLREEIAIVPALLPFFFLAMSVEIFLAVFKMPFTDIV